MEMARVGLSAFNAGAVSTVARIRQEINVLENAVQRLNSRPNWEIPQPKQAPAIGMTISSAGDNEIREFRNEFIQDSKYKAK